MNVRCIAFEGPVCVASGPLADVIVRVKEQIEKDPRTNVLILDSTTSEPVEIDFRGSVQDVLARLAPPVDSVSAPSVDGAGSVDSPALDAPGPDDPKTPGRPRLGVVAREVTLLPRHWEWLAEQPGGASVTLRKLVEEARKATAGGAKVRRAQEACYRFMNTMAGNEPGFEEALRALYAGEAERYVSLTEAWPDDVRDHARRLAADCFPE